MTAAEYRDAVWAHARGGHTSLMTRARRDAGLSSGKRLQLAWRYEEAVCRLILAERRAHKVEQARDDAATAWRTLFPEPDA